MAKRRPTQRRTRARAGPPGERDGPTAHAFEADRATTAFRKPPPEPRSGLGTVRQARARQRSTSVLAEPPTCLATPTAQTSPEETTDTPNSSSDSRALAGPVSTCHPAGHAVTGPAPPVHDGQNTA